MSFNKQFGSLGGSRGSGSSTGFFTTSEDDGSANCTTETSPSKKKNALESFEFKFEPVWSNPTTFDLFKKHVIKEKTEESILFILAVNKSCELFGFKNVKNMLDLLPNKFVVTNEVMETASANREKILHTTKQIIAQFIEEGAEHEINIPGATRTQIRTQFKELESILLIPTTTNTTVTTSSSSPSSASASSSTPQKATSTTSFSSTATATSSVGKLVVDKKVISKLLTLFEAAYLTTMMTLKDDCFTRFKRSKVFEEFVLSEKNASVVSSIGTPKNSIPLMYLTCDDLERPYVSMRDVQFLEFLNQDLAHWKLIYGDTATAKHLFQDMMVFQSNKNLMAEDVLQKYGYFGMAKRVENYPIPAKMLFDILTHNDNFDKVEKIKKTNLERVAGCFSSRTDPSKQILSGVVAHGFADLFFMKRELTTVSSIVKLPHEETYYVIIKNCDYDRSKTPAVPKGTVKMEMSIYMKVQQLSALQTRATSISVINMEGNFKHQTQPTGMSLLAKASVIAQAKKSHKKTMKLINHVLKNKLYPFKEPASSVRIQGDKTIAENEALIATLNEYDASPRSTSRQVPIAYSLDPSLMIMTSPLGESLSSSSSSSSSSLAGSLDSSPMLEESTS